MNKKDKITIMIFLSSFIFLNVIGYFFDIDILKTLIIKENGFTFYFASLYISLLIIIIYRIVTKHARK